MKLNIYSKSLLKGKEIVIVTNETLFDSAIFWLENNYIYTFSRHLGEIKRSLENYTIQDFNKHIENLLAENAMIFIRGNA